MAEETKNFDYIKLYSLETKLKYFDLHIKETAGCGHYLICQGGTWSIKITKSDWQFTGSLDQLLTAAITEIKGNRIPNDNPRNKKPFRY